MKKTGADGKTVDMGPQGAHSDEPVKAKKNGRGPVTPAQEELRKAALLKEGETMSLDDFNAGGKGKAVKTAKQPKAAKVKEIRPCGCGCEQVTASVFAPGHDARLWGVGHKVGSGKLTIEDGIKALKAFPKETVATYRDRLNQLAGAPIA